MKLRTLFLIGLAALPLAMPVTAHAGLLEFLFPTLRNRGPDPSKTLQAPFAYDPAKPVEGNTALPLPENTVPLEQPHAKSADLGKWLMVTVSELLTLDYNYKQTMTEDMHYFSPNGQQQYQAYLAQNNIIKTLDTGSFQINSVVTDVPTLLNQGVVDGRYRWLYEVPVMITYIDRNAKTYKKTKPTTQKLSLIIQVGRIEKATPAQSVAIDRWTGKNKPPA